MAQELTVEQVRFWKGYFLSEPFGCDWQRTARLAAWVAAAMGAKIDEDSEDKFLPTWRKRPQTDDEIAAELAKIPWVRSGGNGSGDR